MSKDIKTPAMDDLFDAILSLKNREECYRFFEDVCTVNELLSLSQRFEVARMLMEKRKLSSIWTPKAEGVMYPMSQIPPQKRFLEGFNWFDYVRPTSKYDIFVWRPKKPGTEIKAPKRKGLSNTKSKAL